MLAGHSVPNAIAAHTRNPPAPRVSPGMSSIRVGWRGQGITVERSKLLFLTYGEECFGTQFPRFSSHDQNARKAFPEEGKATETTPCPKEAGARVLAWLGPGIRLILEQDINPHNVPHSLRLITVTN
ncbi:hypothetical protein DPX16_19553 [Anabarilius grahami]|uniref:Uncharacterized protein n=1 Tax=Anabarilius grahami TaxID=495550 RepID=A0A3N0YPL7_ANAGA|nr:hypothetical protein DPX16_19553 [Anabarilius grahami]